MNRHDAKTIISGSVFVPSVILEAHMMDEKQFAVFAAKNKKGNQKGGIQA